MTLPIGRSWIALACVCLFSSGISGTFAADPPAKMAVKPVAPDLPAALVAAIQDGRYDEAEKALDALASDPKTPAADRPYLGLIRGTALRLAGKLDAARGILADSLKVEGRWTMKLRSELAAVEVSARNFAAADALARVEAETLLAGDRKDRLAEVYRGFANRLLHPDLPTSAPDAEGAYALLTQARSLAKGQALRASILVELARASGKGNNLARTIQDYQVYLHEYPKGADRMAVRYELGEAQLKAGQAAAARLTWSDLARDLERVDTAEAADLRARSFFGIAKTHGIPHPPDDAQMNLGIAALKAMLASYPSHPLSVRASYEIAESYLARGRSQEALAAFAAFINGDEAKADGEQARRTRAELLMSAQFHIGQILQGQRRFDEAIDAYKGYLAKYPNGPQSADAQRAVLDTEIQIADDLIRKEKYAESRSALLAFAAKNPLDARVPELLYQVGDVSFKEKKYDDAIAAWTTLVGKFPNTEPAGHAQFSIAATYENEKGDPSTAIDRFKKVSVDPWKARANQRIAVMVVKSLTVVTERAFRSGETPSLKIASRNIEKLTFTAYKIDPEAYFRKKHSLQGVEDLDIGLVSPDAEWTVEVPGYAKFKPIESKYELAKLQVPGVFVVKVSDEKALQATTLVIGSDVDAIVKTSREQLLVFAQDMKTGKGRAGARVLVSDHGGVILDAKTGPDGVLLQDWAKPMEPGAVPVTIPPPAVQLPAVAPQPEKDAPDLTPPAPPVDLPRQAGAPMPPPVPVHPRMPQGAITYLVIDGGNVAGSGLNLPESIARGITPRAYLSTDRPAYRPGQDVELRGVVREVVNGQYANMPKTAYHLEVYDSRGRKFVDNEVTLSDFGTFSKTIPLDSAAPVGSYRIRLFRPGKGEFAGGFEVQAYQLQKIDLTIDLPRNVYYRGEPIKGSVIAKYQYGTPLAHRDIAVVLPVRTIQGKTDAQGKFPIDLETSGFSEEQVLQLRAVLTQDAVGVAKSVMLAVRAFRIDLTLTRDVFLDGESFAVKLATSDAQGEPTGQNLTVALLKRINKSGQITEREVLREETKTDDKTGLATVQMKADDEEGGSYVVRAFGTDRFKNAIFADEEITISGKKDATKLRILADRSTFKVGETAKIRIINRGPAGAALITWEADKVLEYRILPLIQGDNTLTWNVEGKQFPNFTMSAAKMAPPEFHEARLDVRVERDLRVTIKPAKPSVGPGDEVEIEVTTTDQNGQPVAAEVALAMVDRSLLRLFADRMPSIENFFYNQTRTSAFATESTATFTYEAETAVVNEDVLKEQMMEAGKLADIDANALLNSTLQFAFTARSVKSINVPLPAMSAPRDTDRIPAPAPDASAMAGAQGVPIGGFEPNAYGVKRKAGVGMGGMGGAMGRDAFADGEADAKGDAGEGFGFEKEVTKRRSSLAIPNPATAQAGSVRRFRGGIGGQAAAPASARQRFVETAYWNPSIVTDKTGKATIKFRAPAALSEYRLTARGVSGNDTLVGQTTADLGVKKAFFVDLKTPASLTQGDKPRFMAEVHHPKLVGTLNVRLTAYAGGRERVIPKAIEVNGEGVEEILFEAFEVPDDEVMKLTITAALGDARDEMMTEVPIRPWGMQAIASASGTATDDTTVFVGLAPGRDYAEPEMQIVLSPSVRRMIVELALGRTTSAFDRHFAPCYIIAPDTTADRAGDLLAASSALTYLQAIKNINAPEAVRLTDRIRGLVAELITSQNDDGGWPWVAGSESRSRPSDRMTSARVVWALASAESLGLSTDPAALDKGTTWLAQELAKITAGDNETRATLLHAMSTRGKASFEAANALNRVRQSLSNASLAYLAMTFANLDRASMGNEILGILGPRAKTTIPAPGSRPQLYWPSKDEHPWHRSDAETTALAALAYARVHPQSDELNGAIAWLMAHRQGDGWRPNKAKGPALAAIGLYYGKANAAEDRYRLTVTVNDEQVYKQEIVGATEGQTIRVARRFLKTNAPNRVVFDVEGRAQFGYAVTLAGFTRDFAPDQDKTGKDFVINRRVYSAPAPSFDGKALAQGFGVAINAQTFENTVTQAPLGGKVPISVEAYRVYHAGQPAWDQDFLVLQEFLPAGASIVEGSIQSPASHYTIEDGLLTLYFTPDQYPGVSYEVYGTTPGEYRALPPILSSAYEPGRRHVGPVGGLKVLAPGEKSNDAYKPTPDELYARGKALFDAGRLSESAESLQSLWGGYTLRDDIAKDAARMLLTISIREYNPRNVVIYFEVLKEKAPELVISFDDIKVVGKAYGDIGEHERAYLVWMATAEASYLEDARVGEVLRQRGKPLDAIAYLLDLWREYPSTASIQSDFFGLSQVIASLAGRATTDPAFRAELTAAGLTRADLLGQDIRLIQVFLSQSPKDPLADEASLALVGAFLDLENFQTVVTLAQRFAKLYPKSTFLDSFQYSEALGRFHLGEYDRAIAVAEQIAGATYKDANGVEQPSPNKWQALYILGQIYDARREPSKALTYYERVAERFSDAAGAVKALTRKELKLPEVSVIRPGVAVANVAAPASAKLDYRNIAEADVKVYPVDLMRLYLTRRNLDQIAGIDLAGIKPFFEAKVALGDGKDFDDRTKAIDLPIQKDGAYLVMVRGDDRYTSGILLVSPLELQVLEEPESGRVRVTVRDAKTKAFVPKAQVKVIGSQNAAFLSGETDLRGVFVADRVQGLVTAVARKGTNEYAFHRGTTFVGAAPPNSPPQAQVPAEAPKAQGEDLNLEQNLRGMNNDNQMRQLQRLEGRFNNNDKGVKVQNAK